MKVFISWSGENSRRIADALRTWLPSVLQLVKPYFTPADIEKGARWNSEIAKELESSEIGILCITRDNLHSDWVMFEAGALSKSLDKSYVCPVLFDIHSTDLAGPLRQFQTTEFKKEDFLKLIGVINNKLGENKLPPKTLDSVFEKWWPELEAQISQIISDSNQDNARPIRSDRELLEEILELTRMSTRTSRVSYIAPAAVAHLLREFIAVHNENQAERGDYQDTLNHLLNMKKSIDYLILRTRPTSALNELIEQYNALSFECEKPETAESDEPDDVPF